jgi:hypothetical protein
VKLFLFHLAGTGFLLMERTWDEPSRTHAAGLVTVPPENVQEGKAILDGVDVVGHGEECRVRSEK